MTYAELDRRSNQLARFLDQHGVAAGGIVGLHAGRSIASIVAMLATLKLGAAYAPLDPAAPLAYLDWMVRDCGADLVLSGSRRDAVLPGRTFDLDAAIAHGEALSAAPLDHRPAPHDIAYVMYTSGSTGRPKGVRVPHRAVVRLVIDQTYVQFCAAETFLHNAPLAFDASTFEIWGALLHGARMVVIGDDHASLRQIADTLRQERVTTAWFTSGLFNLMVEHQLEALAGLGQIVAGGDVLSPSHVMRVYAALPGCQVVNGYGPTENTTFTCCYRIPREGWGGGPVPIGTPIRGTYVRLLDDGLKPVADGEIGMLYAGGSGLAAGYVGEAVSSAGDFVADPERAGALLYRTGDLARRRADGVLDFLGRRDRQVKIDGKRVELGEIEETLRRCPGVADAVVAVARDAASEHGDGAPILTGYVKPATAGQDHAALTSDVRLALATALPWHMRPAQIVALDAFPLTANGKIDHKRLAARRAVDAPAAPSATDETEQILGDIFARVLRVAHVGPDTNFFDLGATSLKLVDAHASIARLWPSVAVTALFRHPNIRALAREIAGSDGAAGNAARERARLQAEALRRRRSARAV